MLPARASELDQFGILQDVQIDWDWQTKELWGQFQFPVDIARGQGKITGKAKFARIFGAIYGDLFFGQTPATGQLTVTENEAGSVPATTPYGDGRQRRQFLRRPRRLLRVGRQCRRALYPGHHPGLGEVQVFGSILATGIYTFSAADASAAILVSYLYAPSTGGKKLVVTNQLMGFTPTFRRRSTRRNRRSALPAGLALVLNATPR